MIYIRLYHLSAVCCCLFAMAQALPSLYTNSAPSGSSSGDHHQLETIPSLADFGNIQFPHFDVQDLGESQSYVPEKEVKLIRTIKITQPYPVKVPVKVPYPVPVVKPVPIQVTKVVKVPQPIHVDIVKSVQIPLSSGHGSDGIEHGPSAQQDHGSGQWSAPIPSGGGASHFSSEGHGDQNGNYASVISQHAAEYQQSFHQNQQENEGHH